MASEKAYTITMEAFGLTPAEVAMMVTANDNGWKFARIQKFLTAQPVHPAGHVITPDRMYQEQAFYAAYIKEFHTDVERHKRQYYYMIMMKIANVDTELLRGYWAATSPQF